MPENSDQVTPVEIVSPSALHALESAHIDVQVRTAHAYPRDLVKFKKRAMDMVHMDEETAESCIYCRPVGKEQDKKTGKWVEKYAEGPSIRMAEIVGACYGNIRVASRVIEQTARMVKCEGVAHDLESNSAGKSECIEATVDKNGNPYSERQRALMAKVCLAKAYRDATFRIVPRALCKTVFDAAKKIITASDKPLSERIKRAQAWIAQLKIDPARVFAALNVKSWDEITADQIVTLMGLKTALNEGDEKLDDIFPPLAKEPEDPNKGRAATTPPQQQKAPETKAAEKPAEEKKPAPAATDDKPNCKYCGAKVEDMAKHECDQMKAALAKTKTKEPAKEPEPAPAKEPEKPAEPAAQQTEPPPPQQSSADLSAETSEDAQEAFKSIQLLMKQNEVTEHQVMLFCEANKLSKKGQKLRDLAGAKLVRLNKSFLNVLSEIKKHPPF